MDKLKPCPFCGGEARTMEQHRLWVSCQECMCDLGFEGMDENGCYGHYDTEAEAIADWNTRADDQSQAAAYWRRMYEETVSEEIVRCRDCRCKQDVDGRHLCVRWQFATEPDGFCA